MIYIKPCQFIFYISTYCPYLHNISVYMLDILKHEKMNYCDPFLLLALCLIGEASLEGIGETFLFILTSSSTGGVCRHHR